MLWSAAHLIATVAMTATIWFVQVVHYPLFHSVYRATGSAGFVEFEKDHVRRITWVVAPLMLAELATGIGWWIQARSLASLLSVGLITMTWLVTAIVQMPLHRQLEEQPTGVMIHQLVRSNWLRTALWSVRCASISAFFLLEL